MAFKLHAQTISNRVDTVVTKAANVNLKEPLRTDSIKSKSNNIIDRVLNLKDAKEDKEGLNDTTITNKKTVSRDKYSPEVVQHKLDSINTLQNQNKKSKLSILDTATLKVDHLLKKIQNPSQFLNTAVDSARNKLSLQKLTSKEQHETQKLDSIEARLKGKEHFADSLSNVVTNYESKLQVTKLTSKIDSLKQANLPYEKHTKKLDSISTVNPLQKLQSGVGKEQSKIEQVGSSPTKAVNEKLGLLSKEAGGKGNLPTNVTLPKADLNLNGISPDLKMPNTNVNLNAALPSTSSLNSNNLPSTDLTEKLDLPETKLPAATDLGKLSKVGELDKLKAGTTELTNATGKVSGYTEDAKNVAHGDLDKTKNIQNDLVNKLPVKNEFTELQKQEKTIKDQQARLEAYKNPTEYKKQTLARARKLVDQNMALYQKQIQESVDKVSRYQKKLGTVLSATSSMSKKRDAWKRLKPYEKFVPGITWQIQRGGKAWLFDLNPSLRYRLTTYWSVGTGWNERVVYGRYPQSYNQTRVFGPRLFIEVIIFKGISARLDAEDMNVSMSSKLQSPGEERRVWAWNYMAGIKKEFSFIPHVLGNVQFMYKVYSSNHARIYPTQYNIRFGFEYMPRHKNKKSKTKLAE
jgi:hypothetical protein